MRSELYVPRTKFAIPRINRLYSARYSYVRTNYLLELQNSNSIEFERHELTEKEEYDLFGYQESHVPKFIIQEDLLLSKKWVNDIYDSLMVNPVIDSVVIVNNRDRTEGVGWNKESMFLNKNFLLKLILKKGKVTKKVLVKFDYCLRIKTQGQWIKAQYSKRKRILQVDNRQIKLSKAEVDEMNVYLL